MEQREQMRTDLRRVNPDLRIHLKLDQHFLRDLEAHGVLTEEERQKLEANPVDAERIDRLIDLLKCSPVSKFDSFLEVLEEHDAGLHRQCFPATDDSTGKTCWVTTIDLKRRLHSTSILFFHHGREQCVQTLPCLSLCPA